MAKAKQTKSKKVQKVVAKPDPDPEPEDERITLEELDAISSDEDPDNEGYDEDDEELNAEAAALRQAISEGAFDHLLKKSKKNEDEEFIEVAPEDDEDEEDEDDAEMEEDETKDEEVSIEEDSDEEEEETQMKRNGIDGVGGRALAAVYQDMRGAKKGMPWAESFCVVPEKPLPFGAGGNDGNPLDIHDDLKRELAFYNMALDAANDAHRMCKQASIPFTRPEDFFAEMVKTDGKTNVLHCTWLLIMFVPRVLLIFFLLDHMAKVKDRLIFETRKMDAVAQRKSNKEQKLRGKEKQANKIAEKARRKKDHFKAVDDWAKSAEQNRGPATREDDGANLSKMNAKRGWTDRDGNLQDGPNKKRMAADKKFGYGGKTGRFKQNDKKSLSDMSSYNPKGNFSGSGSKSKGGAGAKRQGKRARDATKSRK
jgi:rRNA-processing protein EBP2